MSDPSNNGASFKGRSIRQAVALAGMLLFTVTCFSQFTAVNPETLVNTTILSTQQNCAVSMDTLGRYVVVWESELQDGDGFGIYAKIYNADHTIRVADFLVNTDVQTNDQRYPDVAMNPDGDFCVVWQTNETADTDGWDVYRKIYDIDGAALVPRIRAHSSAAGNQMRPAVAASDDYFAITHMSEVIGTREYKIQGRFYTAAGAALSATLDIAASAGNHLAHPDVAMDKTDNAIFVWQSNGQDGDGNGIYAAGYAQPTTVNFSPTQVNVYVTANQQEPSVAVDSLGNAMVVWTSFGQDGDGNGVYGRTIDTSGSLGGSELTVATTSAGSQDHAKVRTSREGTQFIVTWTDEAADGDTQSVMARTYSGGAFTDSDQVINATSAGKQMLSDVAYSSASKEAVLVWQGGLRKASTGGPDSDEYGIYTASASLEDMTPPDAVCQNITVYLDGAGSVTIVETDVDGGSTDNIGITSSSISTDNFSCADIGDNTVTLTVFDAGGLSDACDATVTVLDTVSPVAVCQPISVYLDGSGNATITAADVDGGSSDNCDTPTLGVDVSAFTCADVGPNNVTLTATDGSSNTGNCMAVVTVLDTVSPVAVCNPITVYLDAAGNATITAADVDGGSTDNCGVPTLGIDVSAFTCADIGPNDVTLTATDGSSNTDDCMVVVTVLDTVSPGITCPGTINEQTPVGSTGTIVNYTDPLGSDNCGAVSVVCSPPSGSFFLIGTTTVTCTAMDGSGNETACTFDVIVVDEALNEECADAIDITPTEFGLSAWESFTLGTSESLAACAGDADDDIWFSFTAASENDKVVVRDPSGGYDVVVEFFDGCGGSSLGCFDNYGAGAIEQALPGGLVPGQQYIFRVYDEANGPSASTQVEVMVKTFVNTQLRALDCNSTDRTLDESVYSLRDDFGELYVNPLVNVNGYGFRFQEQGGGLDVTVQNLESDGFYQQLEDIGGLEYGKTYDVTVQHRVRTKANGGIQDYWSDLGTVCSVALSAVAPTTQLQATFCTGLDDYFLSSQIQAIPLAGATDYRFTFVGGGDTYVYVSSNYAVSLFQVAAGALEYSTSYSVSVEALVSGSWTPPGPPCTIFMSTQPENTQLQSSFCNGSYLYPNSNFILADQVLGATAYEFRFDDGVDVLTEVREGVSFQFHTTSLVFSPGIYQVDVRAFAGGQWSDFQNACPITVLPAPDLQEESDQTAEDLVVRSLTVDMELNLFPNPNDGQGFIMELDVEEELQGLLTIQILDARGRIVHLESVGAKGDHLMHRIAMDNPQAEGLYTLSVLTDGKRIQRTFIVQR